MFEREERVKYIINTSNSKGDVTDGKETDLKSRRAPTPQEGGEGIHRQGDHQ